MEQLRLEDALGTFPIRVPPPPALQARPEIIRLRAAGESWAAVSRSLNGRGIPTPTGRGAWWPHTARRHVDPAPWAAYVRRYRSTR